MPKKRGQNEGSIYKRKNGRWSAQISIQGQRVTKYFNTQREGLDWLHSMRNQINAGLTLDGAQKTLSEFLEQWLGSIRVSVKVKTHSQYKQIVRMHITPTLGSIKLKDLRPDQIQALYNKKLDSGISARTLLLVHTVLRQSLKQALKWGTIGRNPTDAITRPKVIRAEMLTFTEDQARTFISLAETTRYGALFNLALHTGMRQGELLGLKWIDLDWVKRKLQVRRQIQRIPGQGLSFVEPKSAAGRRAISLSKNMVERMRKHYNEQSTIRENAGIKWQENDLVFPTTLGTPMHPTSMYKDFKALLAKNDLPNIRFHDLRHTAATLMLQQGIHPKVVQERLGHADITLTLNTYSHVLPSMQEDAAEKLDELLTPIDVTEHIKVVKESASTYQISENLKL